MVRILGLDPGSRITGYGVVDVASSGVRYVASGCIRVGEGAMAGRLLAIHRHVAELVVAHSPDEIAVERVFMHRNPDSALKLGQARGAALCGACQAGAPVFMPDLLFRLDAGGRPIVDVIETIGRPS